MQSELGLHALKGVRFGQVTSGLVGQSVTRAAVAPRVRACRWLEKHQDSSRRLPVGRMHQVLLTVADDFGYVCLDKGKKVSERR